MGKIAYFISDAHLGANPTWALPKREELLAQWLHSIRDQASHLFIVGDLFEFWMEYKDYVNRHHFKILRRLAELVECGVEVHYISGNHDFRLDSFFKESLGVYTHRNYKIDLQGYSIFLQHGDGLAASDWKYRVASKILHSPLNVFLFRLLHPDWGMALARFVGSTSRDANKDCAVEIAEYDDAAKKLLVQENCGVFIHGHTHISEIRTLPEGLHIHIGQWLETMQFIALKNGQFSCERLAHE